MPGGHVELGEEIETAVLREVYEEVGINVSIEPSEDGSVKYQYYGKDCELQPFLLFESSFTKEDSLFLRQSIIVFYILRLPLDATKIPMKMQRSEVDSYLWLPFDCAAKIAAKEDGMKELSGFYGQPDGSIIKRIMPLKMLFGPYPNEWSQGVAGGHVRALKRLSEVLSISH